MTEQWGTQRSNVACEVGAVENAAGVVVEARECVLTLPAEPTSSLTAEGVAGRADRSHQDRSVRARPRSRYIRMGQEL
jgi:hypothetical protein